MIAGIRPHTEVSLQILLIDAWRHEHELGWEREMPVTVIVGGQFGSEGKGKVTHYLASQRRGVVAVRVGGSNSGHTVIGRDGAPWVFRHLPTPALLPDTMCVLGAGSYIDVDVLLSEIEAIGLAPDRLFIDPNAYVVTEDHRASEEGWHLGRTIGSTQSGTGAAVIDRIRRLSASGLARCDDRLRRFVRPVRPFLRSVLDHGGHVIIEGTQGFGLSVLHALDYPKATSRDTTAGAFVSEAGLSPLDVDEIVLVIRAFPIRVAGDSGPLPNEIDWQTVRREGGWDRPVVEQTSVTKRIRRVGRFDAAVVCEAIAVNQPTSVVLNHADYFDAQSHERTYVTPQVGEAVSKIEEVIGRAVDLVGLGPATLRPRIEVCTELVAA